MYYKKFCCGEDIATDMHTINLSLQYYLYYSFTILFMSAHKLTHTVHSGNGRRSCHV